MKVDIWSDVVCPWCYIGKRRFEQALAAFKSDEEIEIRWRSFELDPNAPAQMEGPLDEALAAKYRTSLAQARAMMDRVSAQAREAGLDFDFSEARGGNTFRAHRLLQYAHSKGQGEELKERLLRAYFTEGRSIVDVDSLCAIAAEAGLPQDECRELLEGEDFAEEVRADEQRARELGVRGVPFFVIDDYYAISGAQTQETFLLALQQAQDKARESQSRAESQGASCTIEEGCEV